MDAAQYYGKYFDEIKTIMDEFDNSDAYSNKKIKYILNIVKQKNANNSYLRPEMTIQSPTM